MKTTITLVKLTLRQTVGRKSTFVVGLFALAPVFLALVYRFAGNDTDPERWTVGLCSGLVVRAMLPLISLFVGVSALGNEIEDGTAIYLLTKPVPRWQIVLAKVAVSWVVVTVLVVPATLVAAQISLEGNDASSIRLGFGVALVGAALAYSTVFILLSLLTSRALIAGLAYVFIWEAVISGIFTGTRIVSVRHLTLGIADAIVDVPDRILDSGMDPTSSLLVLAAGTLTLAWLAVRRLEAFEVREST